MMRQTASSVIRQSMVQPDYKLTNTAKHPIGFPTQETTSIVEEQKESTNMDDPRTSVLNNIKKEIAKSMQFDVSDADLVLVNPANDTMDSDAVVERPGKKIKTQHIIDGENDDEILTPI
ncbi:uncharacterized protein [Montipora capricornis]|uniref:uncharacterized protein n=1 Tax=Montipora capricornis TaxID=246305 RepID=UPI0035F1E600